MGVLGQASQELRVTTSITHQAKGVVIVSDQTALSYRSCRHVGRPRGQWRRAAGFHPPVSIAGEAAKVPLPIIYRMVAGCKVDPDTLGIGRCSDRVVCPRRLPTIGGFLRSK